MKCHDSIIVNENYIWKQNINPIIILNIWTKFSLNLDALVKRTKIFCVFGQKPKMCEYTWFLHFSDSMNSALICILREHQIYAEYAMLPSEKWRTKMK